MDLIRAVAVARRVSNAWTAGWRGGGRGAGGRLRFNLQPFVSQGLGKVVVHRHTDGQLLGASGSLVTRP